eukprot:scaffold75041_cov63-Phaeocystis_antarctica.AAC.3
MARQTTTTGSRQAATMQAVEEAATAWAEAAAVGSVAGWSTPPTHRPGGCSRRSRPRTGRGHGSDSQQAAPRYPCTQAPPSRSLGRRHCHTCSRAVLFETHRRRATSGRSQRLDQTRHRAARKPHQLQRHQTPGRTRCPTRQRNTPPACPRRVTGHPPGALSPPPLAAATAASVGGEGAARVEAAEAAAASRPSLYVYVAVVPPSYEHEHTSTLVSWKHSLVRLWKHTLPTIGKPPTVGCGEFSQPGYSVPHLLVPGAWLGMRTPASPANWYHDASARLSPPIGFSPLTPSIKRAKAWSQRRATADSLDGKTWPRSRTTAAVARAPAVAARVTAVTAATAAAMVSGQCTRRRRPYGNATCSGCSGPTSTDDLCRCQYSAGPRTDLAHQSRNRPAAPHRLCTEARPSRRGRWAPPSRTGRCRRPCPTDPRAEPPAARQTSTGHPSGAPTRRTLEVMAAAREATADWMLLGGEELGAGAAVRRGHTAGRRPRQLVRVRECLAVIVRARTRLHSGGRKARDVIQVPADRAWLWRVAHGRVRRAQPAGGLRAAHLPRRLALHAHTRVALKEEPRGIGKARRGELQVRAVSLGARGHPHIAPPAWQCAAGSDAGGHEGAGEGGGGCCRARPKRPPLPSVEMRLLCPNPVARGSRPAEPRSRCKPHCSSRIGRCVGRYRNRTWPAQSSRPSRSRAGGTPRRHPSDRSCCGTRCPTRLGGTPRSGHASRSHPRSPPGAPTPEALEVVAAAAAATGVALVRVRERLAAVVRARTRLHGGGRRARVVIEVPADRAWGWRVAHGRVRRAQPAGGLRATLVGAWRVGRHAHARFALKPVPRRVSQAGVTTHRVVGGVRAVVVDATARHHVAPRLVERRPAWHICAGHRAGDQGGEGGSGDGSGGGGGLGGGRCGSGGGGGGDGGAGGGVDGGWPRHSTKTANTLGSGRATVADCTANGQSMSQAASLAVERGGFAEVERAAVAELVTHHTRGYAVETGVAHRAPDPGEMHLEPASVGRRSIHQPNRTLNRWRRGRRCRRRRRGWRRR